jgi:hypothetical protein
MAKEPKVRITLSIFDSGCLPSLLSSRIAEVERLSPRTSEDRAQMDALLGQLRRVQEATLQARQRAVYAPRAGA